MSNESTIHTKNIKVLVTGIYKFLNDFSPPIMNDIFQKQGSYYSRRNPRSLVFTRKFTTTYGIDTLSFNSDSLNLFRSNIKRYGTLTSHCKLCKNFIPCVGYID